VPVLRKTDLPRAIKEAAGNRSPRTLTRLTAGNQILQVKILPVHSGMTIVWQDMTERAQAERAEERLTLAAEGANDGLWEWDLRTQEVYFSARWRAMLGLPATHDLGRVEAWMDRVHADDIGPLRAALDAYLSGQGDHLEHEHRIRHEDGSYRRFLCRGVAV